MFNFIAFFSGPSPPEWRWYVSVAYFKGKLYYLSGRREKDINDEDSMKWEATNRVDVRRSNENP